MDGSLKGVDEGNIEVVNGKTWPYLNVDPRKYRFRIVNGGAAIYINLQFGSSGPIFTQIGGDQGFLPNPQTRSTLLIAPGERFDVVVDFKGFNGRTLTLRTDSVGVMQFRVGSSASGDTGPVPPSLPVQPALYDAATVPALQVSLFDSLLGTYNPTTGQSAPLRWDDATTESPRVLTSQVWEIYNVSSQDSHPIHLHEVEFKVLNRQSISGTGTCATACGPRLGETGFKDTVIADRGQITRVMVNFNTAHPGLFAWHCHITPHEDDEMMRPMCIVDPANPPANPTLDGFAGCPTP
jgi:FtsP/CotA-like multicopper oxidase with cupredoxin domain